MQEYDLGEFRDSHGERFTLHAIEKPRGVWLVQRDARNKQRYIGAWETLDICRGVANGIITDTGETL